MTLPARDTPRIVKLIFAATALVGTLDISDALIFYGLRGVTPVRLLQSIATGLLGRSAFSGGLPTALLGITLHFLIAATVATIYLLASLHLPLHRHPFLYGALYGLTVYLVMNYVVVPLSRCAPRPLLPALVPLVNGVAALIFCIGIPLALIGRRYLPPTGAI